MNRLLLIQRMEEKECLGEFDAHINPPNTKIKKVKPNYDYMRKSLGCKIGKFFADPVFSLAGHIFHITFHLKVFGRENLKHLKSGAILTSNHINNVDCALIRYATRGKKLDITVGEFNNYHGVFGSLLRSAGTLPFSDNITCMKNISRAIIEKLNKKHFVLFYPEGSLWWNYRKPRPLHDGAFHFAVKGNCPVVPMFFTFSNRRRRKDGTYSQQFNLFIGKPIYPESNLDKKNNVDYLRTKTEEFNKETYIKFYGEEPKYLSKD